MGCVAVKEPTVTLMFEGDLHVRVPGLGKVIDHDLEDLFFSFLEEIFIVNLEIMIKGEIVRPEPRLFADFPQGGALGALFLFNMAFREIPIAAAVVQKQKPRTVVGFAVNNYSRRNFSFHPVRGRKRTRFRNGSA